MMEEDERREAAIASAASLQPNFVPKSSKLSSIQLSKFQELHKRRLQVKTRSIAKKKIKGNGKSHENEEINVNKVTSAPKQEEEEGSKGSMEEEIEEENSSFKGNHSQSSMKRKKLHWGLDTKERWEMKANM